MKILIFTVLLPLTALAQEQSHLYKSGPKDIRAYAIQQRKISDSIARKAAAEAKLRSFFTGNVYLFNGKNLVIFQGDGPDVLLSSCSRDSACRVPFVPFVMKRAIQFFRLGVILPELK